jgi:hypothetical protein
MYSFSSLCSLWFRKKLNVLTSGFLSSSDKEGLQSEFQVSAVGSHPVVFKVFLFYEKMYYRNYGGK